MEREVQLRPGQAWPFHMMASAAAGTGCFDAGGGNYSSGRDYFVLGPPLGCFGVLAADVHGLVPFLAGMEYYSPAPALVVPPPAHDAAAVPEDLDDLLLNFWDASCYDGDVGDQHQQQQEVALNSGSGDTRERSLSLSTATTNPFFPCDDDDLLSTIFSAGPAAAEAEEALLQAPSSSSSNCRADPPARGAPVQGAAGGPPPSLKRSTREGEESDQGECSQSGGGKRRKATPSAAAGVVCLCPFALLKPDGLDGGTTLADINARILMRPARPVRHPVGEFACAPRVSADQPGISGKAVSSFTRLHTSGRGSITIIRTRG